MNVLCPSVVSAATATATNHAFELQPDLGPSYPV